MPILFQLKEFQAENRFGVAFMNNNLLYKGKSVERTEHPHIVKVKFILGTAFYSGDSLLNSNKKHATVKP